MNKKLYVGGLSYQTTDETLGATFAQAGTVVSAIVIKDKFSGQSKGFGFVEMDSDESANQAISLFDGKELDIIDSILKCTSSVTHDITLK